MLWQLFFEKKNIFFLFNYSNTANTIATEYYCQLLEQLNKKICEKRSVCRKENHISSRQCTGSQMNACNDRIKGIAMNNVLEKMY